MTAGLPCSRIALFACFCGLTAVFAAPLPQTAEVPYLTGRVTDNAEVFSQETRTALTAMVRAHEDPTGDQIAILTLPSLEGGSIEDFAARVFESWKLGRPGEDNGVLIVLSPEDRRLRIEVGPGLRGRITDQAAGRIIRDLMTPRFNRGDFKGGMEEGLRAIIGLLEGNEPPPIAQSETGHSEENGAFEGPDLNLTERILIGAFIFGILGLFTGIGVFTPGVGWFLYLFLIPFWALFPIVVVGTRGALIVLITYLIGYPVAKLLLSLSHWYPKAKADLARKGAARIGGFTVRRKSGLRTPWSSAS